jgi:cation diffusion facilitator family transporter
MDEGTHPESDRLLLERAMNVSLWVGCLMVVIKLGAYCLTNSSAILSDAAESVVHVVAVGFAAYSLRLTYKPADEGHLYGHAKVSFFSTGFEGALIAFAALYIVYEAVSKWLGGLSLQNLGLGTGLTAFAAIVNGALGYYLLRLGRRKRSIILEANGRHVLTDCWTSAGVLLGLGLTQTTGWLQWDPIVAILVAANILCSGVMLVRRSVGGLMDRAEPGVHQKLSAVLETEIEKHDIAFHDVRHRNVGNAHWVELHLLFPRTTPIGEAHRIATAIETVIAETLEQKAYVTTHLEAQEDHHRVHSEEDHGP